MKKLFALVLCTAALLTLGILAASADMISTGEFYMEEAVKTDEIMSGQAGEASVAWEVPFLHIPPELDGNIEKNEYMPFELYEDYLSWLVNSTDPTSDVPPNTPEDFQLFYDSTQDGFFTPYWGWDGTYLYMAFEVNLVNGFKCTPEEIGGDMFLWAYNCLQVGIAPADATGTNNYSELGFGVHSETGESMTFNWFGTYLPVAGEDFVGYYDQENQVLRYEIRIHLQNVLGLTDRTVENGDEMNYSWVLSVNGETTGPYDVWQIMFARGLSGPLSKDVTYFARVTFTGKPDGMDIPVANIPGMSPEDIEYKLMEHIDLGTEAAVNTFAGENAAVELVTEGEDSFMRITSLTPEGYAYATSSKYPSNLVGGQGDYIVVRYRTSSEKAEELGIIFRNVYAKEYDLDYCYTELVGTDGEWHTVIFYMEGTDNWQHFILNMGFVPFYGAEGFPQETFDIDWIKIYQNDPTDLYVDEIYDPNADKPAETEAPTEAPAATEAPAETEAPAATDAPAVTEAPAATEAPAEGGCGSVLSLSAVAVLAAAAAAVALRKKD